MPWNFPVTEDRSGEIIANAVTNMLQTRQALGRQRTMLELEHPGFHFGQTPTQDLTPTTNATLEPTSVNTSIPLPTVQPGANSGTTQLTRQTPSSVPVRIASPSVTVSQPSQFQATIANAMNSMAPDQRKAITQNVDTDRYVPLSGGYLDMQEMMGRMLPQLQLGARAKYLDAAATAAGTAAGNPGRDDYYASRRRYYDAEANRVTNPPAKPDKPVRSSLIKMRDGTYAAVNPVTNEVTPLQLEGGDPVLAPPAASRTPNPNAEPAAHRDARQAAAATLPILRNTQAQITPLQKQLGSPFATAADSARIGPLLTNLQQRADSLRGAYDQHVHDMDSGTTNSNPMPNRQLPPLTAAQKVRAGRDPQFMQFLGKQGYGARDFQ